jgi:hypothetical protein
MGRVLITNGEKVNTYKNLAGKAGRKDTTTKTSRKGMVLSGHIWLRIGISAGLS